MRIILVDSFYPINSRNRKIVESLQKRFSNATIDVVTWNRENRTIQHQDSGYKVYDKYSPSGQLWKKLLNLYGYYLFLKQILHTYNYDIIIASHWDMLLLMALLKKKKQILIYENLDIPTSYNRVLLWILLKVERAALLKCDAIIFASRFFAPLYDWYDGKKFILENKSTNEPNECEILKDCMNKTFVVAYIGLVRYIDILKNLVDAVRQLPNVILKIHGDGQDVIALKDYTKDMVNVEFTGRYDQIQLSGLYADADLVWAAYPNKDYNVKYAISNKFHESIVYRKPCIFANNTKLGDLVVSKQIGLIVDPYNTRDIYDVLNCAIANRSQLEMIKSNLKEYSMQEQNWGEQFDDGSKYIHAVEINNKL